MSESRLVYQALEWFAINRVRARRNNSGVIKVAGRWIKYGGEGEGDILGNTPYGRYFEAEAKTASGRQRPSQKKHQVVIKKGLAIYILFRSIYDLEANRDLLIGTPDVIDEYYRDMLLKRERAQHPRLASLPLDF